MMKLFISLVLLLSSFAASATTRDIPADSLHIKEQASAASATAGYQRCYFLSSDHLLYCKDSSGVATTYQVKNANLTAFAGLTGAADKGVYFTGAGALSLMDVTSFARTFLDDADASTVRTTLGLVIGTDVQAYDADLAALAALSGTDTLYYRSAANTWTAVTISTGLSFSGGVLTATGGGGGSCSTFNENPQSGTTYTLAATDFYSNGDCPWVSLTNASDITVTVPLNATIAIASDNRAELVQMGAGRVCLSPESGSVTIVGNPCTSGPFARMYLDKIGTNSWKVSGQTEGLIVASALTSNCTMTTSGIYDVWDCVGDTTINILRGSTSSGEWAGVGAGGAGGGTDGSHNPGGGGGGGGGITSATGVSLSPGTVAVDLGTGGVSTSTLSTNGTAGGDTIISGTAGISTTAGGGSFAGQYQTTGNGGTGRATNGNGGGGSYTGGTGGAGSGAGNAGGAGGGGGEGCGGGGGGSGAAGTGCSSNTATNGGVGSAVSLCGGAYSKTWAGGGGGGAHTTAGTGGTGGGGAGSTSGVATSGTANTGGGGGGAHGATAAVGGNGGTGGFGFCYPSRFN